MKQTKQLKLFGLLHKMIGWLKANMELACPTLGEFNQLLDHQLKIFNSRGKTSFIAYNKALRGALMNYLSGNTIKVPGVRLTKDGIPVCFGSLIRYIRNKDHPYHISVLKMTFSILSISRAMKDKINPDFDAITHPYKGVEGYDISQHIDSFWKTFGYKPLDSVPSRLKWKKFHFTTKSGPKGHALNTWLADWYSLPKQLRESISEVGGSKMRTYLTNLEEGASFLSKFFVSSTSKGDIFRKLVSFSDKEGKTRVIAILDYFSQSVLKPLHLYLFNFLKKIDQDCTFDQNSFKTKIADWEIFYSVDLKAATDRFPISLISSVLKGRLPVSYVQAWEDIMVGYPFISENHEYKYSVGNPMGAYSSWSSFTLAHHYIFFFISKELNIPFKQMKYCLLGDDVLIGDADIAQMYMEIMKNLGIEISISKTHISPHFCEFAKQLIYRNENITPFQLSALKHSKTSDLITSLLVSYREKGWSVASIPSAVSDFFGRVRNLPSRVSKKAYDSSEVLSNLIYIIRGDLPAGQALTALARKWGFSFNLTDEVATNIIANIMVELFSASQPQPGKGKPLGLLAENFLIFLTGAKELEENPGLMEFHQNPLTDSYGSIEQQYLDLLKIAKEIDTVKQGQWPLLLRSMTIPLSDRLFIDRFEDTEVRAISSLGKPLKERFEVINQYPQLLNF
nr:RNA-dependent RNA polymerase [Fusarium oxysporum mitovirus 3]